MAMTLAQINNARKIQMYARAYGATARETQQLLSLAWSETRLRNVGEGATASASKRKTGGVGAGIFQYTSPSLRKKHHVSNPWSIAQSTRGALQGLRENRAYWTKRGYKPGTRQMSELIWASWNAGTGRAARAIKQFDVTRHHVLRAGAFMNNFTDPRTGFNTTSFGGNNSPMAQMFNFNTQGSSLPDTSFSWNNTQPYQFGTNGFARSGTQLSQFGNNEFTRSGTQLSQLGNNGFNYNNGGGVYQNYFNSANDYQPLPMFSTLQAPQQQYADLGNFGGGMVGSGSSISAVPQRVERLRVRDAISPNFV